MKTRILGAIFVLILALLFQGAFQSTLAQDNNESINRLILLKGKLPAGAAGNTTGFAKLSYKSGRTPFQRFQVVATGLKPSTDYQLFANGLALDIKRSSESGSIEFLFSSNVKNNSADGALELPKALASVLTIQNISIREKDLTVALLGDFNEPETAVENDSQSQVLSAINNITMESGKTVSLIVPLSDPDGDAVTLSVSCDRGNFMTVNDMTLIMSPQESDVGTHICTAKVTDTFGLSTQIPFVLTVTPANKPPVLSPIADQIIKTGEVKDINIQAVDPDGNSGLRLLVSQGPAYLILSDRGDGSGILRIAPQMSDSLGGIVTIKVIDAGGLTAQTSFTLTLQKSVMISAVTRSKPNLFISGAGFGQSGARVSLNNQDISAAIIGQSDSSITLKGGAKKLNLKKGTNQITITVDGVSSNTFTFSNLDE